MRPENESERIPDVITIKACNNHNLAILICGLAAEIIQIFKELSLINTNHIQLPTSHQQENSKNFINIKPKT